MNVVDSSGWLEYFSEDKNADFFAPIIEQTTKLIVPSISLLEVFKKILHEHDENEALRSVAVMQEGQVIELDATLAIFAAKLGRDFKLPLADSVMYATARAYNAMLWTQDSDFKGFEGVRYIGKK